jgi:hypothetical protein
VVGNHPPDEPLFLAAMMLLTLQVSWTALRIVNQLR